MYVNTLNLPIKSSIAKIECFIAAFASNLTEIVKYYLKWLNPGLSIKRWLVVNAIGILLASIGLVSFCELNLVIGMITSLSNLLGAIANIFPGYMCSIFITVLGLWLMFIGQTQAMRSIANAIDPKDTQKIDLLLDRKAYPKRGAHTAKAFFPLRLSSKKNNRRLHQGKKIVAVGGGTGLSSLLKGLKHFSHNLTAIVTVADDGGSSGRLRTELGVLPPGDIRNCVAALAKEDLLTELFQYRFSAGDGLKGHSFGNLFLTAMTEITGNFETAIAACSRVLAIKGQVLPATLDDMHLWAELDRGQLVEGESNIAAAKGKIEQIGCIPANPTALPATIKAIKSADCIVLGPGSLYTSIIPNLLVPEIRNAIANARVPRIYVCNIMTQPGETDDYTVSDHLKAIERVCGQSLFDLVIVNQQPLSPQALAKYAIEGSYPVTIDRAELDSLGCQVIFADILDEDSNTHCIRHNSWKIAKIIAENNTSFERPIALKSRA